MASKKRSYDNEGEEFSKKLKVEGIFGNEEGGKESESHNKPSKEGKKHVSFERVWSEDQEISIINTAIKFSKEKGLDPASYKTDFFVFTRESQSFDADFTKRELAAKLKSLKKKFGRSLKKDEAISSPHEKRLFHLSKQLWGNEDPTSSDNEISIISKKHVGLGKNIVEKVMKEKGEAKRAEFLQQWMEVEELELELSLKRAELVIFESQIMSPKSPTTH